MSALVSRFLRTESSWAALVLRLTLGIVMLPHGAQKMLGWFGGYGFSGTMAFFTETMGIPWILALAAVLAEFFGSIALIAGAGTRLAAAAIGVVMIVAAVTSHLDHGFFMNWYGNQRGEGFEFHVLVLGLSSALLFLGGGTASLDKLVTVGRSKA